MPPTNIWANNRLRLIVTGKCNINCFYCHNEGQPKSTGFFPSDLFARVVGLLSETKSHLDSVTFSGGEPLLHPMLENFIAGVAPFSDQRTLVTNGLLLTPDRISRLVAAGVSKIRLGVDSLQQSKSRPSSDVFPDVCIQTVIHSLFNAKVKFELNVVLTQFNAGEIGGIVKFCDDHRVSVKFFEHIQSRRAGILKGSRTFEPKPYVGFEDFESKVRSTLSGVTFHTSQDFGGANLVCECDGYFIRYCRYLCPFGLCYRTGTRIDSNGFVYTCMEEDGRFKISSKEPLTQSESTILAAKAEGCNFTKHVFQPA
jgi:GTP 3',8-cyclase